ncbi:DNA helicase II [Acetobacteraceae bacterium]|nr:DNA helicase II [Acetobacteraceae bacterium]
MLLSDNTAYLDKLNPEQRAAVEQTEGSLLILAGAGTGKTSVLTTRFAHLLLSGKAYPSQILAVTFTNKAAREMRERIAQILDRPIEGLWLGTFHSLCVRILRQHATLVGLQRDFLILDSDDQLRLIKQLMADMGINPKVIAPQKALNDIQLWKDKALTYHKLRASEEIKLGEHTLSALYQRYQERLISLNACDFGDLMLHVTEIFIKYPEILSEYQRRFRYIMVDEYQDTNAIQYLWLRLLSRQKDDIPANLACVGDDDQSIYSWRGADITNILRFQKDFPGANIIRLERNYRSTQTILSAASGLIAHNQGRLGKELCSGLPKEDKKEDLIKIIPAGDSNEEADCIAEEIRKAHRKKTSFDEMAILIRASFQARSFEDSFIRQHIPYRIISGQGFYERAEIRDCIAYIRTLVQPADDLAFERIINLPRRGMGNVAIGKLREEAQIQNISLQNALIQRWKNGLLKGKKGLPLIQFVEMMEEGREHLKTDSHGQLIKWLLEESGYIEYWKTQTTPDAPGRLENIQELLRAIDEFPTLEEFLEHIALVMDVDALTEEDEYVSIMTLHAAKGLEFDLVFLPGWEEGIFPSQRSLDERGTEALEEERRLAYVGLTRARKTAIISHAARRRIYGNWQDCIPSRFIREIPVDFTNSAAPPQNPYAFSKPSNDRKTFFMRSTPDPTTQTTGLKVGQTISHKRFGDGVILEAQGNQLIIRFEDGKTRCLMADYVTAKS